MANLRLSMLAVPFVLLLSIENCAVLQAQPTPDFRKITWGMTKGQVKAVEDASLVSEDGETIKYGVNVAGLKALLVYWFIEGKLIAADYVLAERYVEPNQYLVASSRWGELLDEKYGLGATKIQWINDLYREDKSRYGLAVSGMPGASLKSSDSGQPHFTMPFFVWQHRVWT